MDNLSHLCHLRVLNLAGNELTHVDHFEGLHSLVELNLRRNKISQVVSFLHAREGEKGGVERGGGGGGGRGEEEEGEEGGEPFGLWLKSNAHSCIVWIGGDVNTPEVIS